MNCVSAGDQGIVREFLEQERGELRKDAVWVEKLTRKIEEALEGRKANYIFLTSLGNTGCTQRQIRVEPKALDLAGPCLEVVLCTCGSLSCWGNVREVKWNGLSWKEANAGLWRRAETARIVLRIQAYLEQIQSGHYGTPTLEELQFCGSLHRALENKPGGGEKA